METDHDLITQSLLRTGYLAVVFTVVGWWYFGWSVGAGIAVGAALAILNTMALRFVLDRLIPKRAEQEQVETRSASETAEDEQDADSSSAVWAVGLFLKMTLLLGAAYIAMALFGVDPMGLVFGYSLLLPGVMWAWWEYLASKPDD